MAKYGSMKRQTTHTMNALFTPGVSRHELKRDEDAGQWIVSINTMKKYTRACVSFTEWCRDYYGIRDIRQVTPAMAEEYVQRQRDEEKAGGTIGRIKAAIRKLDQAMRVKGHRPRDAPPLLEPGGGWHSDRRPERAYAPEAAERIIENMTQHARDPQTPLVAKVQWATGARIDEAVRLRGEGIDAEGCRVTLKGKGGKVRTVEVDPKWQAFLAEIEDRADGHRDGYAFQGRSSLDRRTRDAVRCACERLGEDHYATHGFRKCYAQERYRALRGQGLDDEEARLGVSHDLGHNRLDVTYSYIPRG